jgi:hypothetical protein
MGDVMIQTSQVLPSNGKIQSILRECYLKLCLWCHSFGNWNISNDLCYKQVSVRRGLSDSLTYIFRESEFCFFVAKVIFLKSMLKSLRSGIWSTFWMIFDWTDSVQAAMFGCTLYLECQVTTANSHRSREFIRDRISTGVWFLYTRNDQLNYWYDCHRLWKPRFSISCFQ